MAPMSRASARRTFEMPVRLSLVEDDLDKHEERFKGVEAAVESLEDTTRERLTKILWAVVSLALSFGAAAISFTLAVVAR